MNLDAVVAGKNTYGPKKSPPQPGQPSLLPKRLPRPTYRVSHERIDRVLHQMATKGLCGGRLVGDYLCRQLRHNCRPNTIRASAATILLFLAFFKRHGGSRLEAITKDHIISFVEHEQDRGMAPTTIDARLKGLYAFLNYRVRRDVIGAEVINRKLRIRVPEALPKAIDPEDVRQLLAAIETTRDRALILTLLRTGMRIGELLNTRVEDLNLNEQWVQIIETQKTRVGRVVYLSTDAVNALATGMQTRTYQSEFIFYVTRLKTSMTRKGQDIDDLKAQKGPNIDDPV